MKRSLYARCPCQWPTLQRRPIGSPLWFPCELLPHRIFKGAPLRVGGASEKSRRTAYHKLSQSPVCSLPGLEKPEHRSTPRIIWNGGNSLKICGFYFSVCTPSRMEEETTHLVAMTSRLQDYNCICCWSQVPGAQLPSSALKDSVVRWHPTQHVS